MNALRASINVQCARTCARIRLIEFHILMIVSVLMFDAFMNAAKIRFYLGPASFRFPLFFVYVAVADFERGLCGVDWAGGCRPRWAWNSSTFLLSASPKSQSDSLRDALLADAREKEDRKLRRSRQHPSHPTPPPRHKKRRHQKEEEEDADGGGMVMSLPVTALNRRIMSRRRASRCYQANRRKPPEEIASIAATGWLAARLPSSITCVTVAVVT